MRKKSRMEREAKTVEVMIRKYCKMKHGAAPLCKECAGLLAYTNKRLAHCPFQEGKTTCGKCRVHCYKPAMREKIRKVMRVVGPHMALVDPLMAVRHLLDGLRKEPLRPVQKTTDEK